LRGKKDSRLFALGGKKDSMPNTIFRWERSNWDFKIQIFRARRVKGIDPTVGFQHRLLDVVSPDNPVKLSLDRHGINF
jgi:hypothetical protein